MDYSALLYDPIYAELGVSATFIAEGTVGEVTLTVIDKTRRKSQTSGAVEVHGVGPSAAARVSELSAKGIARDDYKNSMLTFNGRTWTVRHYDLTGSPNGEDFGEVIFQLIAMP